MNPKPVALFMCWDQHIIGNDVKVVVDLVLDDGDQITIFKSNGNPADAIPWCRKWAQDRGMVANITVQHVNEQQRTRAQDMTFDLYTKDAFQALQDLERRMGD